MTITSTIAAVNAAIVTEVAAATSSVGSRVADDHGAPPRVRWIPTADEAITLRVTLRAYVPETAPTVVTVAAVAFDTTGATEGDGEIFVPSDGS